MLSLASWSLTGVCHVFRVASNGTTSHGSTNHRESEITTTVSRWHASIIRSRKSMVSPSKMVNSIERAGLHMHHLNGTHKFFVSESRWYYLKSMIFPLEEISPLGERTARIIAISQWREDETDVLKPLVPPLADGLIL